MVYTCSHRPFIKILLELNKVDIFLFSDLSIDAMDVSGEQQVSVYFMC